MLAHLRGLFFQPNSYLGRYANYTTFGGYCLDFITRKESLIHCEVPTLRIGFRRIGFANPVG